MKQCNWPILVPKSFILKPCNQPLLLVSPFTSAIPFLLNCPDPAFLHRPVRIEKKMICAFLSIEHDALINVEGSGLVGVLGFTKRLFGTLEQGGINVILISQA
jgi:hypothetical protein